MKNIFLTANLWNLGERVDLAVVKRAFGAGEVYLLDEAIKHEAERKRILAAIEGKVPIVAGGGTMMKFFETFWKAAPADQKFLFFGTGVCWPYGTNDAFPIPWDQVDSRSRFRGPVSPLGYDNLTFIPPPGLLYTIPRDPKNIVVSVHHPLLVDDKSQSVLAKEVARRLGASLVECSNNLKDLALYSTARLIITSRLHGAVIAAANQIPCFVISRDHKIDWFAHQVGLPKISPMTRSFTIEANGVSDQACNAIAVDVRRQVLELESAIAAVKDSLVRNGSGAEEIEETMR